MNYLQAKDYILDRLVNELPPQFTYHSYHHTLDVCRMCVDIAENEGVRDEEELHLLQTAAMYHDSGFILSSKSHEDSSCDIARQTLGKFDYSNAQIEIVCGLIHATKIPQHPTTKLEEILADADLDYLGREDYYAIANTLYTELSSLSLISSEHEWYKLQIRFLETHQYFTNTCKVRRKVMKEQRLQELKELLKKEENRLGIR